MPTLNYAVSLSGGGSSINRGVPRTTDGVGSREVSLPVGKAGTLSTRTDNDTGVLTVATGHGVTTSNKVDVYWAGGMRYGMTVTATTGTTISIDAGSGDNLPSAATAIVVAPQVQINADIDGDALSIIGVEIDHATISSTDVAHIDFQDSSSASIAEIDLVANIPKIYDIAGGATNPFTGNPITKMQATNGSSTEATTLRVLWAADSTP